MESLTRQDESFAVGIREFVMNETEEQGFIGAVHFISDEGKTEGTERCADLMESAGEELAFQKAELVRTAEALEPGMTGFRGDVREVRCESSFFSDWGGNVA